MKCDNCGAELQEKDIKLVCPNCGMEYAEENSVRTSVVIPKRTIEIVPDYPLLFSSGLSGKSVIVLVILIALILVILFKIASSTKLFSSFDILKIALIILVVLVGIKLLSIYVLNRRYFKVGRKMERAERLLSDHDYEKAIKEYMKVINYRQTEVEAYLGIAKVYEDMGDIDQAIKFLRSSLESVNEMRIKNRLQRLLNPKPLKPYGSMGLATIEGNEYDIATVTELDLSECFSDDNDNEIEKLINLEYLNLSFNFISNITLLSNLTNLIYLNLNKNCISDISPLTRLKNLTDLSLCDNEISNVSTLENITGLTFLSLKSNEINDISPLANLTQLIELKLDNNRINNVHPLANLTNLMYLDLERNEIRDISPLANLTNLLELKLNGNPISEEDKTWLKQKLPNCEIYF